MKLTPIDHLNPTAAPAKISDNRDQGGQDFAKILAEQQQALTGGRPAESSASTAGLENNALTGLILTNRGLIEAAGPQAQTRKQLEKTLDQIDRYSAALGDLGQTVKDIAPLADGLGQSAGRLSQLSQSLPESDPLKGLSNEAAVLATVEAMKFRRGDYI